jgi:ABC-2 type transport system ATP-binding protein
MEIVVRPAIQIKNLMKVYPNSDEVVLKNINLTINEKDIFGLLGPNGAGKTTTISILCGITGFNSGEVQIFKYSLRKHLFKIKKIIGIVPQEIALYSTLTARENLRFIGAMYGLSGKLLNSQIEFYLDKLDLIKKSDKKLQTYSGGMKRRVNLIAGVLHKPSILFLDEPTVGIDVQSKKVIHDFLLELNQAGTTIVYTSHYMEEAEHLCTRVSILDNGNVLTTGTPRELIGDNYKNLEHMYLEMTGKKVRD